MVQPPDIAGRRSGQTPGHGTLSRPMFAARRPEQRRSADQLGAACRLPVAAGHRNRRSGGSGGPPWAVSAWVMLGWRL